MSSPAAPGLTEGEGEVEVTWRVNLESLLVPLPFDKFLFSYPVFYFFI